MSQQSLALGRNFVLQQGFLSCDMAGQDGKIFHRDKLFLGRDKVG